MNPREFCNWFEGVLDMAEADNDGPVTFNVGQLIKIREKLAEALKEPEPRIRPPRPDGQRC